MGVFASFCQFCGLPVQHDHYVPTGSGMLKIYRGEDPNGGHEWEEGETPFPFTAEHDWLRRCVGLSEGTEPMLKGTVSDGALLDEATKAEGFVGDGADEYYAYHAHCWELLGQPQTLDRCLSANGAHTLALLRPYQQQLFEFRSLSQHGKGWMLVDPRGSDEAARRSRARLEGLLALAKARVDRTADPSTVPGVLAADDDWRCLVQGDETGGLLSTIRFRRNVVPSLDVAGYTDLVWFIKDYDAGHQGPPTGPNVDAFERFEQALKEAVERDDEAILVMTMMGRGCGQYLVYTKDEAKTCARIDALPGRDEPFEASYSNESDPTWNTYFTQVWPGRDRS